MPSQIEVHIRSTVQPTNSSPSRQLARLVYSETMLLSLLVTRSMIGIIVFRYYEGGANAVLPDFFNSEVLDKFLIAANTTWNEILQHNTSMELWLGETSSCSGGGAPVLSSSYVAGFM